MQISKSQARRFLLAHQGLWPPHTLQGKNGVLAYLRKVGCIQYDPLNVVGHNSELVLQSRVADFKPELLRQLLYEERRLVDGWEKQMAIYPVEDWPYFERWREAHRRSASANDGLIHEALPQVRQAVAERGPLSSHDLDLDTIVEWDWYTSRLARAALESLYIQGELVIHHKVHTRKIYDLAERCLPAELISAPDPHPEDEHYQDWYVERRIGSVGMLPARSGEAWYMHAVKSQNRARAIGRLLDQGQLIETAIDGLDGPFYLRSQDLDLLTQVTEQDAPPPQAAILAPLDNLLWDRRYLEELFSFFYRWEVYVPANKRLYGYYVLPVLYGERFVARFDPGFSRKAGVLTIKNWWWEADVTPDEAMRRALAACLRRFMEYLGAEKLVLDQPAQEAGLDFLLE